MIIKTKKIEVGEKRKIIRNTIIIESESPNPELFTIMINEIKVALDVPVKEVTKIFGYEGTDQDARNFRRYMAGSRPVSWGDYQLAKQLTGRAKLVDLT